jgi:hypothetical protein
MTIPADVLDKLLTAMRGNNLIALVGAGLSMAPPSNLPNAKTVANICYDRRLPLEALPPALRDDIEGLAGHFYDSHNFREVFLDELVPWNELVGRPNAGHEAIGDFLVTGALRAALTSNFDPLIERWAQDHKVALRGALDGNEAVTFSNVSSPLIKFHGCWHREPEHTVWSPKQLTDAPISDRIASFTNWVNLHLPNRHLLVIGFWSDWDYLSNILISALTHRHALSVTVVDPSPTAMLQAKASGLWAVLNSLSAEFTHVPMSGADFLEELRTAFSRAWLRAFYALANGPLAAVGQALPHPLDSESMGGVDLYFLRRDVEGHSYDRAAHIKWPVPAMGQAATFRSKAINSGAMRATGSDLTHNGLRFRVINGAGLDISEMTKDYRDAPSITSPDVIACVGASKSGTPATIVSRVSHSTVVRGSAGGGSRWLTEAEAIAELSI